MAKAAKSEPDIFVSYSRQHEDLVSPLVRLLRVGGRLIFQDVSSIEPGDEWEQKIILSLRGARDVVVIWCSHAEESKWVRREVRIAVRLKKRVIPVTIDETPLPRSLGKYQRIDLSESIRHAPMPLSLGERLNHAKRAPKSAGGSGPKKAGAKGVRYYSGLSPEAYELLTGEKGARASEIRSFVAAHRKEYQEQMAAFEGSRQRLLEAVMGVIDGPEV